MKKSIQTIGIFTVALLISVNVFASNICQIGTIESLMKGMYQGTITVKQAKEHGSFGLGCGVGLGELVVLDGKFYLVDENGDTSNLKNDDMIPFGALTKFEPTISFKVADVKSIIQLENIINSKMISKNIFYAAKITGDFNKIDARSEKIATPPYEPLKNWLEKHQTEFYSENCKATLVAIISPNFVKGSGVPGYHIHYITDDKTRGGHVFDMNIKDAEIKIMPIYNMLLVLPQTKEFLKTDFNYTEATHKDLEKVEKGRSPVKIRKNKLSYRTEN